MQNRRREAKVAAVIYNRLKADMTLGIDAQCATRWANGPRT